MFVYVDFVPVHFFFFFFFFVGQCELFVLMLYNFFFSFSHMY